MQKVLQNRYLVYSFIFLLLALLITVRWKEHHLFYDPFLKYFKGIFQDKPLPNYNFFQLIFNYIIRYSINSILSIGIIYLLFKDFKTLRLIIYLYVFLFLILLILLIVVLFLNNPDYNFPLFYIRRFIIQPVFLILFVPALYFQKMVK